MGVPWKIGHCPQRKETTTVRVIRPWHTSAQCTAIFVKKGGGGGGTLFFSGSSKEGKKGGFLGERIWTLLLDFHWQAGRLAC